MRTFALMNESKAPDMVKKNELFADELQRLANVEPDQVAKPLGYGDGGHTADPVRGHDDQRGRPSCSR